MIYIGEAAKVAGVSKSTLLRAVKKGKISASRNDAGAFMFDPSELARVYPGASVTQVKSKQMEHYEVASEAPDALVLQLRQQLSDMREDRDAWREQAQRLALVAPTTHTSFLSRIFGKTAK